MNNKGPDQTARMQGWSVPVLFVNPQKQVFSSRGPYFVGTQKNCLCLVETILLSTHNMNFARDKNKFNLVHMKKAVISHLRVFN